MIFPIDKTTKHGQNDEFGQPKGSASVRQQPYIGSKQTRYAWNYKINRIKQKIHGGRPHKYGNKKIVCTHTRLMTFHNDAYYSAYACNEGENESPPTKWEWECYMKVKFEFDSLVELYRLHKIDAIRKKTRCACGLSGWRHMQTTQKVSVYFTSSDSVFFFSCDPTLTINDIGHSNRFNWNKIKFLAQNDFVARSRFCGLIKR